MFRHGRTRVQVVMPCVALVLGLVGMLTGWRRVLAVVPTTGTLAVRPHRIEHGEPEQLARGGRAAARAALPDVTLRPRVRRERTNRRRESQSARPGAHARAAPASLGVPGSS